AAGEAQVKSARRLVPRDAATLILVDRSAGEPRVLMGRRRATQVFLPNKFVFPGGRVDRCDRTAPCGDDLDEDEARLLLAGMKGRASLSRARALALAAIRETFEETGLVVGCAPQSSQPRPARMTPEWQAFLATGRIPAVGALRYFARAITPPSRPRRYDTRFFIADASAITARRQAIDDELRDTGWFTLGEIRGLDLPNITRAIVEDLAFALAGEAASHRSARQIPFYAFRNGSFRRDLIA
ncbi:MAG: NUDIX hydrolase, partial [Hyphomicrobiaceae bacterium]